jgi:gluconokinase
VNYFLGIDIGTTHTKAVIVTNEGKLLFEAKEGYELLRPQPGYEEQDVRVIMNAVKSVINQAFTTVAKGSDIIAASFSAAMHSILPVDEKGDPLYNAITWADTRSKQEAHEISCRLDADILYANTLIPAHPMSPLCKIAWFRNNKPELFEKTARFISIKEYVLHQLFGRYIVDYSVAAATGLFNLRAKVWDPLALEIAGIGADKLSVPVSTTHAEQGSIVVGNTNYSISFVAGASDGCLANLGSGAILHGETALTIGTSGAVRMTVHGPTYAENAERLFIYPLADDIAVSGGAINNGGIVLKWLAELFEIPDESSRSSYESILSMAERADPGADGLLFLPYLLGERAPVWDADAKGVFVGLTMRHQKEQLIRSAIEGICFTLHQLINKLESAYGPVKEINVSGGFVRSAFWVQLIADITGKKLKATEMADASAIGAAYLAMFASGYLKQLSDVKRFIPVSKVFEPVLSNHKVYAELFRLFESLYPKLKDDFAALSRLQKT